MANSKNAICGGFVALNTGTIVDCYSNTTVHGNATAAGFCGNNTGVLKNAYTAGRLKKTKISGGFLSRNSGSVIDCFYDKSKTKSEKLVDLSLGKLEKDLTFEKTFNQFDWDFDTVWESPKTGKKGEEFSADTQLKPFLPTFIKENFFFELPPTEDIIALSTAEELFEMAAKINNGDKRFVAARYILTNDINLKKKKWTPIGIDENNPFSGTFDGAGYRISNVLVNDKDLEFAGFFGMLKDAIILNLGIEGVIKKGKYSGSLAGVNEGGRIDCCFANGEISSNKFPGGFVGKNTGDILHCFVIGKVKNGGVFLLPWILGALALACIVAALFIWLNLGRNPTYPAIPIDENVKVIPGEKIQPREGNSVSFQFDKQIVFQNADAGGVFTFKNPGDSNKNIVVELQLTDAEIIRVFGTTCQTPVEQAKIETQPGYSPEITRQVIGRSGAIPPGYALDEIRLQPLQDEKGKVLAESGIIKPGEYVQSVALLKNVTATETNVNIVVVGYVPDTYESRGTVGMKSVLFKQ